MKEEIISQLDFTNEEYEQKVAGQRGVATFDEFIANIIESVKDNNGTVQDAIYIANDAFAKL